MMMNNFESSGDTSNNNVKPDPYGGNMREQNEALEVRQSGANNERRKAFNYGEEPLGTFRGVGAAHIRGSPAGKSRPSRGGAEKVAGPDYKDQVRGYETGDMPSAANLMPTVEPSSIPSANDNPTARDLENPASDNLISAEVVEPSLPATVYQAQVLDQDKEERQRRCLWMLGIGLALLVVSAIAGGIGTYFGLTRSTASSQPQEALTTTRSAAPTITTTVSPTNAPVLPMTSAPTISRTSQIEAAIVSALGVLPEPSSPQGQALDWLVNVDQADNGDSFIPNDRLLTRFALATFFYAANGPNWASQANFLSPTRHECDWNIGAIGIACNSMLKVTAISLVNNRLGGTLPTEIGLLTSLEILGLQGAVRNGGTVNVSSNLMSGYIPKELRALSNLIQIDLSQNGGFDGAIPAEISQLNALVELRLNDNELTGLVPAEIGDMLSLTLVDLSNNNLTGPAPTSFDNIRCALLSGNMLTSCFFRRNRFLQASSDLTPEGCSRFLPPCGLPSSN